MQLILFEAFARALDERLEEPYETCAERRKKKGLHGPQDT